MWSSVSLGACPVTNACTHPRRRKWWLCWMDIEPINQQLCCSSLLSSFFPSLSASPHLCFQYRNIKASKTQTRTSHERYHLHGAKRSRQSRVKHRKRRLHLYFSKRLWSGTVQLSVDVPNRMSIKVPGASLNVAIRPTPDPKAVFTFP